ncbi:MAG: AbrB/MazE/SpoVT family DNA-binding domain-containing protein [Methanothrix sp.]|jgi:AbrB family transcriptional regulator (stage V sporulation protein T)|nr:AbrB/MazE/SpoVT family DNA-binding domain-containing protein [Methanothrix sp.]
MPFTKVDEKGRMVLPNEIRRRMSITAGDEFVIDEVGPDTILLRKVDVRAMIQDAIERAKSLDLDKLQKDMEEEGDRVARKMYKVLD